MSDTVAVCWRCGTREAEKWRFCSIKREYVCINCERICSAHSDAMLPNGTHCRALYIRNSEAARLLNRRFPASPAAIAEAREYWLRRNPATLPEIFKTAVQKHDNSTDEEYRANARPHLAALQELIKEMNESA